MGAEVAIGWVVQLRGGEIAQFDFSYAACLAPQDFPCTVDASHDIEETGRVLTSSIQLFPVLIFPLVAITLSVARPHFPQLHLPGPVDISDDLMLGDVEASGFGRDVIEGVLSEEVVPEDEDWRSGAAEVVVPLLEDSDELVALFSDWFLGEEEEFGLAVDVDQEILALLDEWVGVEPSDELQKRFLGELATCGQSSPGLDEELLLRWVVHLTLYVGLWIVGGEMRVGNDDEVSFGV